MTEKSYYNREDVDTIVKCITCKIEPNIVYVDRDRDSHDLRVCPDNSVLMEIICRVKPQTISFLSANVGATIAINIGLNPPVFASNVPQKLKVDFIMVILEHVTI